MSSKEIHYEERITRLSDVEQWPFHLLKWFEIYHTPQCYQVIRFFFPTFVTFI